MTQPLISSRDGQRTTVNAMMKSPRIIPRRILKMLDQEFLTDVILRNAGGNNSGVVRYWESTPLFANVDAAVVSEFGQIPVTTGNLGKPKVAHVEKRGLGVRVSREMRDRNDVDAVNTQIIQVRNTMTRTWEDAFLTQFLANPNVHTTAASTPWSGTSTTIRKDINTARFTIKNSAADVAGKQKFGFVPNLLVLPMESETDFLDSDEVSKPYVGNIASSNLQYTGKLPNRFLNLDVVVSWRLGDLAPGTAILLERKTVGGYSDERVLQATPMYGEGGGPNGGPNESWRSDTTRGSALFVDQPLAASLITGI